MSVVPARGPQPPPTG